MNKDRECIGVFPTDHTIRLFLPDTVADDAVHSVRATLATWFSGAVTYRAHATWQQEGSDAGASIVRVVETHATDEQVTAHRAELQHLVATLQQRLGADAVVLDINNTIPQTTDPTVYSTEQAAEYLGLSVATVKHHVHNVGDLHPIKIGPALAFTRDELDRYHNTPRPRRGRPKRQAP